MIGAKRYIIIRYSISEKLPVRENRINIQDHNYGTHKYDQSNYNIGGMTIEMIVRASYLGTLCEPGFSQIWKPYCYCSMRIYFPNNFTGNRSRDYRIYVAGRDLDFYLGCPSPPFRDPQEFWALCLYIWVTYPKLRSQVKFSPHTWDNAEQIISLD